MDVSSSEFIASSPNVKDCPNEFIPEYAFIGRSNVGKSSLVNSICRKRNIAKISVFWKNPVIRFQKTYFST